MKKELIVMLGAAVLGTVCCSNMTADKVSAKTSGDYKYVITGKKKKTCAIRKYTGKDKDVTVPDKLDGYTVTRIGDSAFARNKKIQNVKLPKHITIIGEKSFSACLNLKSITLSPKVHTIRKNAFRACRHLNDIRFSSNLKKIGDEAFSGCESLKEIKLPDSVEKIGSYAFFDCGENASIYIPKNLGKTDLRSAFDIEKISNITVADGNKFYDSRDNCNAVIETAANKLIFGTGNSTVPGSVSVIGSKAFADCSTMKTFTVPATVSKIEDHAFYNCSDLETVNFSEGLTNIGDEAFRYCDSLKDIKLPDSVETIGKDAFCGCNKVENIYISKNLGKTDFANVFCCESLTKVSVSGDNKFYDSRDNCNAIIETAGNKLVLGTNNTSIPDSISVIGSSAFSYLNHFSEITIPESVKTIEDNAFYGCTSLKEINLPDSVETIGEYAFYDCKGVEKLYIPKNLGKTDLPNVFECISLTEITVADGNKYYDSRNNCNAVIEKATDTMVLAGKGSVIPDTVKVIGPFVYTNVPSKCGYTNAPSKIVIPEGVEKISNNAFNANDAINTVTIPVSIKEIGYDVFDYGLQTINYRGSKAQWKKIKISNPDNLKGVKINYNYKG